MSRVSPLFLHSPTPGPLFSEFVIVFPYPTHTHTTRDKDTLIRVGEHTYINR